ncbi:hypothetical protein R50073_13470 [Maricurvus nonylphenolicus]|uniref:NmrA family NAD(P)-binding protein n=1 Tax=Maricurvus nonylphenolicus TaxID=1008307 RepID=UPI0036F284FE
MSDANFSDPLASILVFGASGHVGSGVADHILKHAPDIRLRLATSDNAKRVALQQRYPHAEVCVCSYYDLESLVTAFDGVEGVYMITPDFTNEQLAVSNIINAAKGSGSIRHIVRLMGDPPGMTLDRVPEFLRNFNGGASAAVGHTIARQLFDASGLPVTYTSVAAYFMDDLSGIWHGSGIVNADILAEVKCHHMPYVDPAEVGEAAARIFLRRNPQDIGADYLLNNGIDCWDFHDVSKILSEELGRKITYIEGEKTYRQWIGVELDKKFGKGAADFMIAYFRWEDSVMADIAKDAMGGIKGKVAACIQLKGPRWLKELLVRKLWESKAEDVYYDHLEVILQRKPKSLRQWIKENKHALEKSSNHQSTEYSLNVN